MTVRPRVAMAVVVLALVIGGGCSQGASSAQRVADEALPGQLRLLESRRTTTPGGFFPATEATYAVTDDADAVITILNPTVASLPPALQRARAQTAELRALRGVLDEQDLDLLGFRVEQREAGVEVASWVAADLGPSTYADTRRRLDSVLTAWAATRSSPGHPGVSPTISSLSLGIIDPADVAALLEDPRRGYPTIARLGFGPRLSAATAAQTALVFTYPRPDGRLWATDLALAPSLGATERRELGAAAGAAARSWLAAAGEDVTPAADLTWLRVEDGSLTMLRGYLLLCAPGAASCNVPSSTGVLGLTVDRSTRRFTDLALVEVDKEPDGTWPQPLEPERLD